MMNSFTKLKKKHLVAGELGTVCFFNPFPPSVPIWHRLPKLSISILEGIIKNIPMSVATMSR